MNDRTSLALWVGLFILGFFLPSWIQWLLTGLLIGYFFGGAGKRFLTNIRRKLEHKRAAAQTRRWVRKQEK